MLFRVKPITQRLSFSGYLALLVEAVIKMEFDPLVFEVLASHDTWTNFENNLYCTYLSETFYSETPDDY